MSQHIFETPDGNHVTMGYDRPLNYVICIVSDAQGDILYSNLSDPNAGTEQQSVGYFEDVLKQLGITVPDSMYAEVSKDQLRRVGNRVVTHSLDRAEVKRDFPNPNNGNAP